MYDTIHLWIGREGLDREYLDSLLNRLSEVGFRGENVRTGEELISGRLDNFKVIASPSSLAIKGSLAKFYFGNNFETLCRKTTGEAIEKLNDRLQLKADCGKISRLDFAGNLRMEFPVKLYYRSLGSARYFERLEQPDSLDYRSGTRQMLFYDKMLEARTAKDRIPAGWDGVNILRYEYRLLKRPVRFLNRQRLVLCDLGDRAFFTTMVKTWQEAYEAIHKVGAITMDWKDMNSPKEVRVWLAALKVQEMGPGWVNDLVESLRHSGAFDRPEYYSRLRTNLNNLSRLPIKADDTRLSNELTGKVSDFAASMLDKVA